MLLCAFACFSLIWAHHISRRTRETPIEAATKSVLRTAGSTLPREILRGVLGGMRRR